MTPRALAGIATGRTTPLFSADVGQRHSDIAGVLTGARVLFVGGAGSIGSATVREVCRFRPAELVVVDTDENGLAELIRDLRGGAAGNTVPPIITLPIDFGSEVFHRVLADRGPFQLVLNFAALKHVRSEKDVHSVLQMIDTNVVKVARCLRWLGESPADSAFFSVSTDKAANPVNVMGASKRVMEQVMFAPGFRPARIRRVSSARFANVAFSNGSLLAGWMQRLAKRQPIACPEGARRYFVSLEEAGQLCLIAATLGPDGRVIIPSLEAGRDLVDLAGVAREFLRVHGFTPREYREEEAARAGLERDVAGGAYPLLLTPLDTDGEKPYEVFSTDDEQHESIGLRHLEAVVSPPAGGQALQAFVTRMDHAASTATDRITKADIVAAIGSVVPAFRHAETGRSLDERL